MILREITYLLSLSQSRSMPRNETRSSKYFVELCFRFTITTQTRGNVPYFVRTSDFVGPANRSWSSQENVEPERETKGRERSGSKGSNCALFRRQSLHENNGKAQDHSFSCTDRIWRFVEEHDGQRIHGNQCRHDLEAASWANSGSCSGSPQAFCGQKYI